MGLKEEVGELLRQGREAKLAELAIARPAAVRPLLGRLWDREPARRVEDIPTKPRHRTTCVEGVNV